jgi:hypothetical protein
MNAVLRSGALAFGVTALGMIGCNKNTNDGGAARQPTQPHTVAATSYSGERRAEERRAEARAEERRAEERADEHRALERRSEERVSEERAHERGIGGGPVVVRASTAVAVESLADARCDRAVRCGDVAPHQRFSTRAACVSKVESEKFDDLNVRACPGGIDAKQLDKCVTAIRADECGNAFERWNRLNACRSANLCLE